MTNGNRMYRLISSAPSFRPSYHQWATVPNDCFE